MLANDLEGIVAKRLDDPYDPRVKWFKIKKLNYTQKGGEETYLTGRDRGNER